MNKKWKKHEIYFLYMNYPILDINLISINLNRTHSSIYKKAFRLDIKQDKKKNDENIINKKFNKLSPMYPIKNKKYNYWKFKCDCGKETITIFNQVKSDKIKSCGCIRKKFTNEEILKKNQKNNKLYYQNNKYKIRNKSREYKIKNPEYIINYRKKNREKITKKSLKYHHNKKKINLNYKLSLILRSRFKAAIKNNCKTGSAVKDLGCSIEKFKLWIEMHWKHGMTWDNYGFKGWHIDHIKPLSTFNLSDRNQLLEACNFSNLQPLWWYENLSKGDKFDYKN